MTAKIGSICVAAVVAGALLLAATPPAAAQSPTLEGRPPMSVVSWAGPVMRSEMIHVIRPYREARGRWVNVVAYRGGLAEIRNQVDSLNVTWDVVSLSRSDVLRGCLEGLLEPLEPGDLPLAPDGAAPEADFHPGTLEQCGIGFAVWAMVVAYDPDRFAGDKPSTVADFFDVERFPGRRGLRRSPKVALEWALMADGVAPVEVYDVLGTEDGLDRAFEMLDRIRDEVLWWEDASQVADLLKDGTLAITALRNGRVDEANRMEPGRLAVVWDGQIQDVEMWSVPRGSDHLAEARDFIAFATDPVRLARMASELVFGPARRSALPLVAARVRPYLPTEDANERNSLLIDSIWWARNQEKIDRRFDQWLEPSREFRPFTGSGAYTGN